MTPTILALMLAEAVGIWWVFCRPVGRALREARWWADDWKRAFFHSDEEAKEDRAEAHATIATLTAERDEARAAAEYLNNEALPEITSRLEYTEHRRQLAAHEAATLATERDAAIARADDLAARLAGETVRAGEAEAECATWRATAVRSAEIAQSAVQEQERLARIVARRDQPRGMGGRFGRREAVG